MAETTNPTPATGYQNGSDLLISIGGKALGHCTSHQYSFSSETKDHAVKPAASEAKGAGLFKDKQVVGLSSSIKSDGLVFIGETELSYAEMLEAWASGQPVDVKAFKRKGDTTPFITAKYIITSLDCNAPANDDSTYSISLENTGTVTISKAGL